MNESKQLTNDYISRINKVIDYIEQNLNKSFTLEELAKVANFSKFHFSRIFSSVVDETLFQFILRLRLEKAASMILFSQNESITNIAFTCGFSDITVFSRSFKNHFKVSASRYKREKFKNSNISQPDSNKEQQEENPIMYICPKSLTIKWRTNMKLNKDMEVKVLPKFTVAYIRNIGPYNGDQNLFQKLRNKIFTWAGARGFIVGKDSQFLVLYHDDPTVAIGDNLRMSLCVTIPPETNVDGEIGKMEIESMKYAVARFELTGQDFQKAWNWIYGTWFPSSGFQPSDKPYFEMFLHEPIDGKYLVDFCVPVKPL